MNDVEQAIKDIQDLEIDPVIAEPLIQRIKTEGLTDAVRQELVQVLEDAYKESALTVALAEQVQQLDQETDDQLSGQLNTYYDQVEQQLTDAGAAYPNQESVLPVPAEQPNDPAPAAAPVQAQIVASAAPGAVVPVATMTVPIVEPAPASAPQPVLAVPLASVITKPTLPVEDSDWLNLLNDVKTTAAASAPQPVGSTPAATPTTTAAPTDPAT